MNRINRRKIESKIGPKQWPIRNKAREKLELKKRHSPKLHTYWWLIAIEPINVLTTHLIHIHTHTDTQTQTYTQMNTWVSQSVRKQVIYTEIHWT